MAEGEREGRPDTLETPGPTERCWRRGRCLIPPEGSFLPGHWLGWERGERGDTPHHTTPHIIKMSGQECVKDSTPHYIRDTSCLTLFLTGGVFIHYQSANTSEMMDPHHGINIISKVLTTALEKSPDSTIYYRQPVPVQCYHIPDHYIVGIDNSWQWT